MDLQNCDVSLYIACNVWIGIISYSLNPVANIACDVNTTVFDKSHLKSLPSTGEWLSG